MILLSLRIPRGNVEGLINVINDEAGSCPRWLFKVFHLRVIHLGRAAGADGGKPDGRARGEFHIFLRYRPALRVQDHVRAGGLLDVEPVIGLRRGPEGQLGVLEVVPPDEDLIAVRRFKTERRQALRLFVFLIRFPFESR